jgi:hypothetical protein
MVVKRKIPSPHWESNPRTLIIQPVAQCYTGRLSYHGSCKDGTIKKEEGEKFKHSEKQIMESLSVNPKKRL